MLGQHGILVSGRRRPPTRNVFVIPRRRKAVALALVTAAALYALPTAFALDAATRTPTATWSPTRRPIRQGLVDPPVLIFAYTPVEDPAVYAKVWDGFLKHLEKITGKRVQFFPVQSNAAQIEAMRAGRLHVAGFNTGATRSPSTAPASCRSR